MPKVNTGEEYMEQYSAMSTTAALAMPSRSSRRLSNKGNTISICLPSAKPSPEWNFGLKMASLSMQTAPAMTSSSVQWSFTPKGEK